MSLDSFLDGFASGYTAGQDPCLLFAGPNLPDYSDRLPDDYNVVSVIDADFEVDGVPVDVFVYEPRAWKVDPDGTFTLFDGHLGDGYEDLEPEFEVSIEPDDYVAYRIIESRTDGNELADWIPSPFTVDDTFDDGLDWGWLGIDQYARLGSVAGIEYGIVRDQNELVIISSGGIDRIHYTPDQLREMADAVESVEVSDDA